MEKKNNVIIYVYRLINDGFKSVFDVNQQPEVHLAGSDYSFALIGKENLIFKGHLWIYLTVTQSSIDELVRNVEKNVICNNFYTFPFKALKIGIFCRSNFKLSSGFLKMTFVHFFQNSFFAAVW